MSKNIYFIGGAPRNGKSTVALRSVAKHPMMAISTDSIRRVATTLVSPEENPGLHRVGKVSISSENFVDSISQNPKAALDLHIRESEQVWRSVLSYIEDQGEEGHDLVVEGIAVLPKLLSQCTFDYRVIYLVPTKDQTEHILRRAKENPYTWLHKCSEENIRAYCGFLKIWQQYYIQEAKKYNMPIIEIDFDNFEQSVDKAVSVLLGPG